MDSKNSDQKITQIPENKGDTAFQKAMDGIKGPFEAHKAGPGPVQSDKLADIPQEGTKEERRAKAAELNK